jgi:hypothetical protein
MYDYDEIDVTPGDEGSGEAAVPSPAGSDATGGYDYDGEKFTPEQLNEAIEAWRDKDAWNASFKQRDQRDAAVRDALKTGFGKNLSDFDEKDLLDLKSFGLLNTKIRTDPGFARAWEESLVDAYKRAGASKGQAESAAAKDVAAAKAGEPAKLPEEVQSRLKRIDDFENMVVEQGLAQFESRLETDIRGAIDKAAGDLTGKFYPLLRSIVLQGLSGKSDVQLLEAHQSGTLGREVAGLARGAAKTLREHLAGKSQAVGDALAASKSNAAPAPSKGGVAERVDTVELKPGGGMSRFHDKLRAGLGR